MQMVSHEIELQLELYEKEKSQTLDMLITKLVF